MYTICFDAYPSFISLSNEKKILKRLSKLENIEEICKNSANNQTLGIISDDTKIETDIIRQCINKISFETEDTCHISLKEGEKYKIFVCCGTIIEMRRVKAIISATSLEKAKIKLNKKGYIGHVKEVELI